MPARILVSGVSGPIGAALLPSLRSRGYKVVRLVRGPASGDEQISWDPAKPLSPESVSGFEAVIHLAGESIVGRWTAAKKARIRDSRVLGTGNLAEALARAAQRPGVLITASAVGYYGHRGDEVLQEDSSPGQDFLAEVCHQWEAATQPAAQAGIRTVNMRIGLILSPVGGALPKMLTPFRLGVGGNIGNGRQWWSWIDVSDVVGAVHHIMKTDLLQGPVNLVAPKPVTNAEFTKTLAEALHRPAIFPMPAFAARLAFGEMADELLLASQRVEPTKLVASGYPFQHSDLKKALEDILTR
ncbi:MAG TPA: TIGR01777 family oxidoreductase [Terriglobales bacterium]|nr:TIGR01777 family oxidoreductase [Terriglobales bacterium]